MNMVADTDIRQVIDGESTRMAEIRDLAKRLGNDHGLAMRLWPEDRVNAKLLAILVMEKKQITVEALDRLIADIETLDRDAQDKLCDWLLANQLMYIKKLYPVIEGWMDVPSLVRQRLFWSYQARIMRKTRDAVPASASLLSVLEKRMGKADPFLQGAMNWCAAQIGIYDARLRSRCIALGENTGLYRDFVPSKDAFLPTCRTGFPRRPPSWPDSGQRNKF
jgi:3-methyladenine DNA glycosylase AlkD